MTWVKFDDKFYDHPKVSSLSPKLLLSCVGLHLFASCWCASQLTDGAIPTGQVTRLVGGPATKYADELVRVGLWEAIDTGYKIHDYLDYNPSRETRIAERAAAQERMKHARGARRSTDVRPNNKRTVDERIDSVHEMFGRTSDMFAQCSDNPVPVPDVLTEHEEEALRVLAGIPDYPFDAKKDLDFLREPWDKRLNLGTEAKRWRDWWEPKWAAWKKQSPPNYRLAWRNWMTNADRMCKERQGAYYENQDDDVDLDRLSAKTDEAYDAFLREVRAQ